VIIRPPADPVLSPIEPVVFLAGPVTGAEDWQHTAEGLLGSRVSVANPRVPACDTHDYVAHLDWKSRWMRRAALRGCLLFWLAEETTSVPGRAYAQTTRFELGEWLARGRHGGIRFVLGIDDGYTGMRAVLHRLTTAYARADVVVTTDLTDACRRALVACNRVPP